MKMTRTKSSIRKRGFITLAEALFIAAITLAPFVISGALELWESETEYPQSIYAK